MLNWVQITFISAIALLVTVQLVGMLLDDQYLYAVIPIIGMFALALFFLVGLAVG